jgi:glycosyltransferase involved in cell wall biosynthesis
MEELAASPELCAELGRAAQARQRLEFTEEVMARRIIEIYRSQLA